MKNVIALSTLILIIASGFAQGEKNLAQKLGFKKDAKLLIIHADDIGVAHAVNSASFDGFSSKIITSGSVMVPCPWFLEVADYAKRNPSHDLGLRVKSSLRLLIELGISQKKVVVNPFFEKCLDELRKND